MLWPAEGADPDAVERLTRFWRALGANVELMDDRHHDLVLAVTSHLPHLIAYNIVGTAADLEEVTQGEVIGHGMNAEELAANPRLDRWFIHDLNRDPVLPLESASLDAAMICVGVQYLQRPAPVFQDLTRVLKPGAPLVVSFSNRCFPTKAVAIWMRLDDRGHAALVELYLNSAGFNDVTVNVLADGSRCDPLFAVVGRA